MQFRFDTFVLNTFDDIKPYLDDLVNREVTTKEETEQWIKDYDVLQAHISENFGWRYIHQTCDTTNEEYKNSYLFFINEISPKLQEIDDILNKKIIQLPSIEELAHANEAYEIWLRGVKKALEMFREENIPLHTELSTKQKEYDTITGAMSIEHDGKTLTMQQAKKYLELPDREVRKAVYEKLVARRLIDADKLDSLLTELIRLRNTIALNAGYPSFIEYTRDSYRRFDYTQEDVLAFHKGVKEFMVPLVHDIFEKKRQKLQLDTIKPYDEEATEEGLTPLKPFKDGAELLEKGIECISKVSPDFGDNLRVMKENNHFDLESRIGKAPGGYNYPLAVTIYPFIFMNAAGSHSDVVTFVHEAGHAMHSFCIKNAGVEIGLFRDYPIEMAEVASMSMELMSMYSWDVFYKDASDFNRAKEEQVNRILDIFPWVSIIDLFQIWLYKNPEHTIEERRSKFKQLLNEYEPWTDWSDYEQFEKIRWQGQMHIYDVPLYYIEYGIAQLGAIGVWKNFIQDHTKGLALYKKALGLGYTKKLPELYATAGIPFDFSPARIKELAEFVQSERAKLID